MLDKFVTETSDLKPLFSGDLITETFQFLHNYSVGSHGELHSVASANGSSSWWWKWEVTVVASSFIQISWVQEGYPESVWLETNPGATQSAASWNWNKLCHSCSHTPNCSKLHILQWSCNSLWTIDQEAFLKSFKPVKSVVNLKRFILKQISLNFRMVFHSPQKTQHCNAANLQVLLHRCAASESPLWECWGLALELRVVLWSASTNWGVLLLQYIYWTVF